MIVSINVTGMKIKEALRQCSTALRAQDGYMSGRVVAYFIGPRQDGNRKLLEYEMKEAKSL